MTQQTNLPTDIKETILIEVTNELSNYDLMLWGNSVKAKGRNSYSYYVEFDNGLWNVKFHDYIAGKTISLFKGDGKRSCFLMYNEHIEAIKNVVKKLIN